MNTKSNINNSFFIFLICLLKIFYFNFINKYLKNYIFFVWFLFSNLVTSTKTHGMDTKVPEMDDLFGVISKPDSRERIKGYLVFDGGDPNLVDREDKQSLLQIYCFKGDIDTVNLLIEKGANIPYTDKNGHHALYLIASLEKEKYYPVHDLIFEKLINIVFEKCSTDVLDRMINHADPRGINTLHIASVKGHLSIVQSLLKHNAKIDQADSQGRTALHFACQMGHIDIIIHLLNCGASIYIRSKNGFKAKNFFILGSLAEGSPRDYKIEDLLDVDEIGSQSKKKRVMFEDESLREFFITFKRKCSGVFITYRSLESKVIQRRKDVISVSNAIYILGNISPLPGVGLVTSLTATTIGAIEDKIESEKTKMITEFFDSTRDMEDAVEESAYILTNAYKEFIQILSIKGAQQLADSGLGRFICFMRDSNTILDRKRSFSDYVLEGVKFKNSGYLERFSLKNYVVLETIEKDIRLTDVDIFQKTEDTLLLLKEKKQSISSSNTQVVRYSEGCCIIS